MKKRLLYYEGYMQKEFRLNATTKVKSARLIFKDIKKGETITSKPLLFPTETSDSLTIEKHWHNDIYEITNDFDILWELSKEEIRPIPYTFEEVQIEYQKLVNTGVNNDEINSIIIELFKNKKKIK